MRGLINLNKEKFINLNKEKAYLDNHSILSNAVYFQHLHWIVKSHTEIPKIIVLKLFILFRNLAIIYQFTQISTILRSIISSQSIVIVGC